MSNQIQESSEPQNQEHTYDPFHSFSTLCLNSSSSAAAATVDPPICTSCSGRRHPRPATTPMKRPSPTPPSQQPSTTTTSKKLFLDHQQPNSTLFSKINLPIPFPPSVSPLRRSVSDPTDARNFSPPSQIQSPAKRLCLNSPLPPLPLRRTVSDPNPSPEKTTDSPIKIVKDSPESKRLKRIKDRLKEMNQLWNEVMSEEEEEDETETKKRDEEDEDEETVGVERVGDSLALNLKCSCGKGFEILLSGRNCFYKLV